VPVELRAVKAVCSEKSHVTSDRWRAGVGIEPRPATSLWWGDGAADLGFNRARGGRRASLGSSERGGAGKGEAGGTGGASNGVERLRRVGVEATAARRRRT
jgi:hypothetical protein